MTAPPVAFWRGTRFLYTTGADTDNSLSFLSSVSGSVRRVEAAMTPFRGEGCVRIMGCECLEPRVSFVRKRLDGLLRHYMRKVA